MVLSELKIPKRTLNILSKKKIITTDDFVRIQPRKYHDYRNPGTASSYENDADAAILGIVSSVKKKDGNTRKYINICVTDNDGVLIKVMIFGRLKELAFFEKFDGKQVVVCGKLQKHPVYGNSMLNPLVLKEAKYFVPEIMPVYRKYSGISEDTYQSILEESIKHSEELIEKDIIDKTGLISFPNALQCIHHPKVPGDIIAGKKRLLFDDLFYFTLMLRMQNKKHATDGIKMVKDSGFVTTLPYPLTADQDAVLKVMISNAKAGIRNDVLLQGDVGCGKTVVAFTMMMHAYANGYQSVLMAPRSVLAKQHYNELSVFAEQQGAKAIFLSSDMKAREKQEAYAKIKAGEYDFIVGTHSCLGNDLEYANLGLIITDEEHLFGVQQKSALVEKANAGVHEITMSATPIPRSMASVLYGDNKEILFIKTMPSGRKPIQTYIQTQREQTFAFMEQEIKKGHQCYVVCPAIEDKEDSYTYSVEEAVHEYRKGFAGKNISIGFVNGSMKKEDTDKVMKSFKDGELNILISTTVIEVGVNVPNATVIVIEQANRFGLASLHQLRGRVGRGSIQSYCILISDQRDNTRLKAMKETTDGFKIAEADLQERGTGNLIGIEQSGANKYVSEMLRYPKMYESVKKLAEYSEQIHAGYRYLEERNI